MRMQMFFYAGPFPAQKIKKVLANYVPSRKFKAFKRARSWESSSWKCSRALPVLLTLFMILVTRLMAAIISPALQPKDMVLLRHLYMPQMVLIRLPEGKPEIRKHKSFKESKKTTKRKLRKRNMRHSESQCVSIALDKMVE